MSGRALAVGGVVVVLAVAGAAGYALLRDDETGSNRPTKGGRQPAIGPGPTTGPEPLPPPGGSPPLPRQPGVTLPPPPDRGAPRTPPPPPRTPAPPPGPNATVVGGSKPTRTAVVKAPKAGGPVLVVLGSDGRPLAGAVASGRTSRRALPDRTTNAQGEAPLDYIEAGEGAIQGVVRHPRYPQPKNFSADANGGRVEVSFEAAEKGIITGAIHDKTLRAPPRAELHVIDRNGNVTVLPSEGFAQWESNGRFRVELAPGSYTVQGAAPGYAASDNSYTTIVANQETQPVTLIIEAAGVIAGRVALPPDLQARREPIPLDFHLEWVRGTSQNPNTQTKTVTVEVTPDGAYRLENLQPGQYRVRVSDGGQRIGGWAMAQIDESSNVALDLNLVGGNVTAPVRGVVRDFKGNLVAGVRVKAKLASAVTDTAGSFELRGLDPGRQEIEFDKPGYQHQVETVEVPGGNTPLPDLVVSLVQRGSAYGKVTRRGAPASGVKVQLVLKVDGGGMRSYGPVMTDAQGGWKLLDLDFGTYVLVTGDGADPWNPQGPTFVVTPGDLVQAPSVDVN